MTIVDSERGLNFSTIRLNHVTMSVTVQGLPLIVQQSYV